MHKKLIRREDVFFLFLKMKNSLLILLDTIACLLIIELENNYN